MFLSTSMAQNLGLLDAGIIALLGYAVVFFGLILLMIVIIMLGKAFTTQKPQATAPASAPAAAPAAPTAQSAQTENAAAPGSAGTLKLHNVEPKTAAMLMAIVSNKMGKPLNELRFKSIKEVK